MNTQSQVGHNNPELLREFIEYDPNTGDLTWRARDRKHFETNRGWAIWNGRYAGTAALNCDDGKGYRHGRIFRKHCFAHRAAWMIAYGEAPPERIDHINGNKSDNRIENLRAVTNSENGQNSKRSIANTSGVTGVCWVRRQQKYLAYIGSHSDRKYLGTFAELDAAVAARRAAEIKHGYHENHGRSQ